jgi:hypothetical protein
MAMSKPRVVMDSAIRVTPRLRALPIELVPLASTDISSDALVDAQALLTRTVTRVDGGLLEGSDIRFVGTASAGTDHIDLNYLGGTRHPFFKRCGLQCIRRWRLRTRGYCTLWKARAYLVWRGRWARRLWQRWAGSRKTIGGAGSPSPCLRSLGNTIRLTCAGNGPPRSSLLRCC